VEKAGLIGLVKLRLLMSDEELSLRGKILRDAIVEDKQRGLIPFYVRLNCIVNECAFVSLFSCTVHVYQHQFTPLPRLTPRTKSLKHCSFLRYTRIKSLQNKNYPTNPRLYPPYIVIFFYHILLIICLLFYNCSIFIYSTVRLPM